VRIRIYIYIYKTRDDYIRFRYNLCDTETKNIVIIFAEIKRDKFIDCFIKRSIFLILHVHKIKCEIYCCLRIHTLCSEVFKCICVSIECFSKPLNSQAIDIVFI